MTFAYPAAIQAAAAKLGAPYLFGGKWIKPDGSVEIGGGIDCSGLSRWIAAGFGSTLPDGAQAQFRVCIKLPASLQSDPPAGAIGFFDPEAAPDLVDHAITSMGAGVVIEARGAPYNCVICRPVAAWLAQPGFLGFYCPPGLNLSAPGTP